MAYTGAEFDPAAPLLGTVLGSYRLEKKLGEGGMGTVYQAVHVRLGVHWAVKVMADDLCGHKDLRVRFFREARLAARIAHRRVVQVIEVATDDEARPYLVMKLEEGTDLGKLVGGIAERADAREIREISQQILDGLAAIHACGIVHRDMKPDNCILRGWDPAQRAVDLVIVDFGIGKEIAPLGAMDPTRTDVTKAGTVSGTPQYMSPEMIRSGTPVDARTDLYAFGCILYELCTGAAPFAHLARTPDTTANALAHMSAHLSTPPPPPPALPHPAFGPVIMRLLEKDPAERFQSAEEVITALEAINLDAPVSVAIQPVPLERRPSRVGAFAGGVTTVVLVVAVGIAVARFGFMKTEVVRKVSIPTQALPHATEAPEPAIASVPTQSAPSLYQRCVASLSVDACAAYCRGADSSGKLEIKIRFANGHRTAPAACR